MQEIWIPELIITFFIMIYFIRPFVKSLWPLDGLVWLPVLAFLITVGLFPAYGFRPECIPLLIFEFILNIVNIPALISSAASFLNEGFRDRRVFFSLMSLVFMGCAIAIMFIFSPKAAFDLENSGVQSSVIRNNFGNVDYFMRVYAPNDDTSLEPHPVLFLVPPEAGSVPAIDRVCIVLRDRGFTVVSYSRHGFDFPAVGENNERYLAPLSQMRSCWQAFRKGTELKTANEKGKLLETERLRDIEFLLPHIQNLVGLNGGSTAAEVPLFLTAYNAGGGAAVLLAGNPGFSSRFPQVRGIIVIESRFWTAYRSEPPQPSAVSAGSPWYQRFSVNAANWFAGFKAQRVSGFTPLSLPDIPVLCLVSDKALSPDSETNPYRALWQTISRSNTATITAVAGVGPLDFSVYPLTHSISSFLFPGADRSVKNADPIKAAVGHIYHFVEVQLQR